MGCREIGCLMHNALVCWGKYASPDATFRCHFLLIYVTGECYGAPNVDDFIIRYSSPG